MIFMIESYLEVLESILEIEVEVHDRAHDDVSIDVIGADPEILDWAEEYINEMVEDYKSLPMVWSWFDRVATIFAVLPTHKNKAWALEILNDFANTDDSDWRRYLDSHIGIKRPWSVKQIKGYIKKRNAHESYGSTVRSADEATFLAYTLLREFAEKF